MVIAHHLIWTAYGWWLPNDPRGSTSHQIECTSIKGLGELHYGRKQIQPASSDLRKFYEIAGTVLRHDLLTFDNAEIAVIGAAFARIVQSRGYTCYACAIMPDHVHVLIRKHRVQAETMIEHLQMESGTAILSRHQRAPDHPVWGGPGWKVFLETRDDIERTIKYIEDNPFKAHRPAQRWDFVTKYDGWLPAIVRPYKAPRNRKRP